MGGRLPKTGLLPPQRITRTLTRAFGATSPIGRGGGKAGAGLDGPLPTGRGKDCRSSKSACLWPSPSRERAARSVNARSARWGTLEKNTNSFQHAIKSLLEPHMSVIPVLAQSCDAGSAGGRAGPVSSCRELT